MVHARKIVASPVGALTLVASGSGLAAILWEDDDPARVPLGETRADPDHPVLCAVEEQLAAYFAGRRTEFAIALDMTGTAFQQEVWAALQTIPFGETRSYAALARQIGRPAAARAVGAAIGRNPVSIVVACHRAVGTNGALTGFAGGLPAKARLLALEGGQGRLAV